MKLEVIRKGEETAEKNLQCCRPLVFSSIGRSDDGDDDGSGE
jgi:hypothetical protein